MKMLASKIKLHNARSIYRSAKHLIKIFPVIYSNTPDFGYSNEKHKTWAKLYPCWSRQYPIVIYSGTVEAVGMAPLQLEGYDQMIPGRLAMGNNGYTVSISLVQDNKNRRCRPPTIAGALLRNVYEFEGLHLHWTKKNNRGCEHVIDNLRYPLEMHLIHRNIKYDSIEKALEHEDGICAAAVFFDIAEMPYKAFNTILDNFIYIQNANTNITLDCGLILETLLPINIQKFYTYKGSMLSPPYNKSISWIIFCQPIYISFDQLTEFESLQKNQDNEIFDNCQNIQPIEEKKIYARDPSIPFIPACDVPCPNIPISTNNDVSCPHVAANYNEMYFPVSPNDGYKTNKKVVSNPSSSNKELLDPTLTKENYQSTATYNEMYFPLSPKEENETNKKLESNPTSTKELLDPTLNSEGQQQSTATYNSIFFPISPKDESMSNKKIDPNPSNNKEALDPTALTKEHFESTAACNEMNFPIPSKDENPLDKNLETNLNNSTNKEELNPNLTKEEHQPTATYNDMCFPIPTKDESASNKKNDTFPTSTNKETLDPKEEHNHSTYNEMYFPIPSKNENESNQKMEPNKEVLDPNMNKKDATENKKEFCNQCPTNVLSSKTQSRGLIANFKNIIKDALIKFFSK